MRNYHADFEYYFALYHAVMEWIYRGVPQPFPTSSIMKDDCGLHVWAHDLGTVQAMRLSSRSEAVPYCPKCSPKVSSFIAFEVAAATTFDYNLSSGETSYLYRALPSCVGCT